MSRCIRSFDSIIAFQRRPNSFAIEYPQERTFGLGLRRVPVPKESILGGCRLPQSFTRGAEEIRDGFLVGYSGSGIDQHLPESLEEALHGLREIAERFEGAAERVQRPQRVEDNTNGENF